MGSSTETCKQISGLYVSHVGTGPIQHQGSPNNEKQNDNNQEDDQKEAFFGMKGRPVTLQPFYAGKQNNRKEYNDQKCHHIAGKVKFRGPALHPR
jgi:hypothetical protein